MSIVKGEEYKKIINTLLKQIETFGLNIPEFKPRRVPTQAFSQFVINKRQGDWAEKILLDAINATFTDIIAVRYGRSEDIIAGEEGFEEFYKEYQRELSEIGKRPDILIFYKKDYLVLRSNYSLPDGYDISMCSRDKLDEIVPHAIAGLEVRSSSFLVDKHKQYLEREKQKILNDAFERVLQIKRKLHSLPSKWRNWVSKVNSVDDLEELLLELPKSSKSDDTEIESFIGDIKSFEKNYRNLLSKQLSFTPKVEDLSVVKTWINTYGVPHYYVQVFFDRIYAISFVDILKIISEGLKNVSRRPLPNTIKSEKFKIEQQPKNQFKTTIYLNIEEGIHIGDVCENECCPANENCLPKLNGKYNVLDDGRVIVAVDFIGGHAKLYEDRFRTLLGLSDGK